MTRAVTKINIPGQPSLINKIEQRAHPRVIDIRSKADNANGRNSDI